LECLWRNKLTIEDMPHMLFLIEEVITVFIFSCLNEVANYLLLLYFIRKTLVTKASVYGIVGSIFIIFVSVFSNKIKGILLWIEIVVFLTAYIIIFLTKRREKRLNKGKARDKQIRYIKDQEEDELASSNKKEYPKTSIFKKHFIETNEDSTWKTEELRDRAVTLAHYAKKKRRI
jgi:predicted membrane protein